MASFTILDSEVTDHTAATSRAMTNSITPALGDLAFFGARNSLGTDAACSGAGMTWTLLELESNSQPAFVAVFRATAGTPESGALTITSSDNFIDTTYAAVRPVDLTYDSVAGSGNTAGSAVDTLAVAITATTPAALLVYFSGGANNTWAEDTGWTETLDAAHASGIAHQLQERFSDDDEVIGNLSTNGNMTGVVLMFTAAGASAFSAYYQQYYQKVLA